MPNAATSEFSAERIKHLEFIQAVVSRLGTSSFLVKGWALTISAAFFAVTASKLNWGVSTAALVPILAFWYLDAFFLRQERAFRCLYDEVRRPDSALEMFSMNVGHFLRSNSWRSVALSSTMCAFYLPLVAIDLAFIGAGVATDLS
ncbi:hypothetical protein [Dactylosporangium sp. NPDC006015]|uniref:hypothetical protein n=1 Tax=Dactylosporangium sp. NPDC006015 TaxID=3154576 RepID=UPI0033BAEBA1